MCVLIFIWALNIPSMPKSTICLKAVRFRNKASAGDVHSTLAWEIYMKLCHVSPAIKLQCSIEADDSGSFWRERGKNQTLLANQCRSARKWSEIMSDMKYMKVKLLLKTVESLIPKREAYLPRIYNNEYDEGITLRRKIDYDRFLSAAVHWSRMKACGVLSIMKDILQCRFRRRAGSGGGIL